MADLKNSSDKKTRRKPVVGNRNPQEPVKPSTPFKRKNLTLMLILVLVTLLLIKFYEDRNPNSEINYSQFKQMMVDPQMAIQKVTLQRNNEGYFLVATRKMTADEKKKAEKEIGMARSDVQMKVQLPFSDEVHKMIEGWTEKGITVEFKKETAWMSWVGSLLPLLLIIGFVWFMMSRQTQGGGPRGIFSFGKSNARMANIENPEITFTDVAGCDEAKQDLSEIIDFLKNPDRFSKLGGKIPKGALLLGPPGTGKTLLAKAVAGEASVPFFSMSGSDFVEMFVGVGASRVRDLFEQGKKNAPCILFIDEIDAVGRHRGAGLGGGHDEREQTLNQLLVEMDGFNHSMGVIVLAATNRPDVLDPALLRPGRFDRQIVVDAPDAKGREGILRVHLEKRKVPLSEDVNVEKLAKATPGLVGADLENLVNEACLLAARFGNKKVSMIDFEEAKDKIMLGTERVSRIISEEEKRTTAYHEAGHALITTLMEHADPLHKITIIPRGRALGITFSLPKTDSYTMSADKVKDRIAILMAGRAAEMLVFNQRNTGASNDIDVASNLARKYVCEWGMSEKMGPLAYGKKQEEVFLGKEISQYKNYSEMTAVDIDNEIRSLVDGESKRAYELLKENRTKLENLAEALLDHETLEGEEIYLALEGKIIEATHKSRAYKLFLQRQEEEKQKRENREKNKGRSAVPAGNSEVVESKPQAEGGVSPAGLNVDTSA